MEHTCYLEAMLVACNRQADKRSQVRYSQTFDRLSSGGKNPTNGNFNRSDSRTPDFFQCVRRLDTPECLALRRELSRCLLGGHHNARRILENTHQLCLDLAGGADQPWQSAAEPQEVSPGAAVAATCGNTLDWLLHTLSHLGTPVALTTWARTAITLDDLKGYMSCLQHERAPAVHPR